MFVKVFFNAIIDFVLRMKVRIKLSLLVGIALAVVVFIISTITINRQEVQLLKQMDILGRNIVQNIADVAKENLILNSTAIIQEHVANVLRRSITGLEELSVVDRNRRVVAHSVVDSINQVVRDEVWQEILYVDSLTRYETADHARYIEPIFVIIPEETGPKRILIGGASISFSKVVLLAPITEMKETIFVISTVVTVAAIILVFLTAGKFVRIIVALSEAARLVGLGHLHVKVDTRIKDEIGTLANEFNLMVRQIREKMEMEKFVSRAIVDMLADGKEATLGGTRRVITIMFTDIRNFTSVSEDLWPEEVVELLNHYLDIQTKIIQRNQGVVDKFLGDGIMALFAGKEMAVNAVTAAIEIQREISRANKLRKRKNELVLSVGIGITIGRAVLGSIGSRDRMDYTVIGDSVNLSSRLCAAADANEILVIEDVVARLNGKIQVASEEKIRVKGKKEEVPVYQVIFTFDQA